ncbi:hypothetical protein [Bergeriella denitrificans]|uniref:Uncharacterized protein n=1 Tax=Bergeriella denitrificans TaxID=494 RepID=A0A378UGF0_BERDE|nr:hypothetical protein [Bergeriella denitrificans]STZ76454.1 Uncharacterised protein [Bergeriella denitrificans]
MKKQAFILSDCEYPECSGKPFALLTANPTKAHHFIAQTEQRQHAHNPEVGQQNQNIYRLPPAMFQKPYRAQAQDVNIISNLAEKNLYTLTRGEEGLQYNLESWFNRHESGYEDSCRLLRTLPAGCSDIPEALWRILRLKLLGILRNPYNHNHLFAHRLHQAIRTHLHDVSFEFVRLISGRDRDTIANILQTYRFSFPGYVNWLANLYSMLSDGVAQPSLFEQMFRAGFDNPKAAKIELYRYTDPADLCLLSDRGFCLQESAELFSIGVNIAHDMFAIVHIQKAWWPLLKQSFHTMRTRKQGEVSIHDGNQVQRQLFNRMCIRQAKVAVYGRSPLMRDYFSE